MDIAISTNLDHINLLVDGLSNALAERDAYTYGHCDRVLQRAERVGRRVGLYSLELAELRIAAKLHDIGKIAIPDRILFKPGRLEDDEWMVMRSHSEVGQKICRNIDHPHGEEIGRIIRHHHEAMDGSGYPDGLAGEAIPVAARIVAISDAYDAMSTHRPYHGPREHAEVMRIMAGECGQKFDPYLFGHFRAVAAEE